MKCRCRQVSRLRRDINYDYNPYDDLKFGSLLNGTEDPTNPFLDYGSYTTKENSDSTSESIQQYDYLPHNTDYPDQYKSKVKEPAIGGDYMKPATPSSRNYIRDDKNPFPMKDRYEYWDPCCGQYLNRSINYTSNELLCFKHLDVSERSFINSVNALAVSKSVFSRIFRDQLFCSVLQIVWLRNVICNSKTLITQICN